MLPMPFLVLAGGGDPPIPAAPVNTGAPVVSGLLYVGATLTTTNGTWTGFPAPTYTYQWNVGGVDVGGATNSTYVLQSGDDTENVYAKVTATNSEGSATADSNTVGPVGTLPVNTVAPSISGTPTEGETLTVANGTWTGTATVVYTYQWKRNGSNISSATASTYLLVLADVGATITCAVTGTNGFGNATATSAGVGPVAASGGLAINYDFTTGSLPVGTTFTRSTTGNYFNSSGVFTSAAIDAPRFEYNPATLAGPYLLYEPQRTNLFLQSEDITSGSWTSSGAPTRTGGGGATSPDGTASDRLTATATNAGIFQNLTLPADDDYTLSRAVRAGTSPYVANRTASFGGDKTAWFNLSTGAYGTVQSPATARIRSLGGGWFDTSLTVAIATDLAGLPFLYLSSADNSYGTTVADYADVWTAQIERGSKATSYIPTTTAAVTRGADTLSFTIPSGVSQLTYTFDDDTTQNVSVTPGAYSVPNTLNRWGIKSIVSDV